MYNSPIRQQRTISTSRCYGCQQKDQKIRKLEARLAVRWSQKKDMLERLFQQKSIQLQQVRKSSKALRKYITQQKQLVEHLKSS